MKKKTRAEAGKLGYEKVRSVLEALREQNKKKARDKYYDQNKCCITCGKTIPYERGRNKTCNYQCRGLLNRSTAVFNCKYCKQELIGRDRTKKQTCSRKCDKLLKETKYIKEWHSGKRSGGYWWGVANAVRRWLISQKGEKCWICGWEQRNPVTGRVPVQVDHIDGNPKNHRPKNLRLICPNCHSLTDSYGALNRGRGRKERYSPS